MSLLMEALDKAGQAKDEDNEIDLDEMFHNDKLEKNALKFTDESQNKNKAAQNLIAASQKKSKKRVKKFIIYSIIVISILVILSLSFYYQDKLVSLFLDESISLQAPVLIKNIASLPTKQFVKESNKPEEALTIKNDKPKKIDIENDILEIKKPKPKPKPKLNDIKQQKTDTKNKFKTNDKVHQEKKVEQSPSIQIDSKLSILVKANNSLNNAYIAYQAGNIKKAKNIYQQVLVKYKNNLDALLGLAAVEITNDNIEQARYYYQKILKFYPQNENAIAGLLSLTDKYEISNESELNLLITNSLASNDKARTAHLYFSLGNIYNHKQDWTKAQQSYFDAYHYDNSQADYAYNLAVSLDHLEKYRVALKFYKKAILLAKKKNNFNFSVKEVQQRINELFTSN
jgi:tetratricopeptide (TPR) repeat protein